LIGSTGGSSPGKLSVPIPPQNPLKGMSMKPIFAKIALFALFAAPPATAWAQGEIEGRWINPKGNVVVHVAPCGNAYCGTVIKASPRAQASARDGGTPHLIGTRILTGVRPTGDGTFKGQVFDPKHNIRAPATIRVEGDNALTVRGCAIAGMLLCKEQRWTRVS
jgi:uncharacterized protein (DUF2147 family)